MKKWKNEKVNSFFNLIIGLSEQMKKVRYPFPIIFFQFNSHGARKMSEMIVRSFLVFFFILINSLRGWSVQL